MDHGEYILIYLDTNYNWLNVYHAMNNHFLRDTLQPVSTFWNHENSQIVNYSRTALAIIPTPVQLDSPKFKGFDFWVFSWDEKYFMRVYGIKGYFFENKISCTFYSFN